MTVFVFVLSKVLGIGTPAVTQITGPIASRAVSTASAGYVPVMNVPYPRLVDSYIVQSIPYGLSALSGILTVLSVLFGVIWVMYTVTVLVSLGGQRGAAGGAVSVNSVWQWMLAKTDGRDALRESAIRTASPMRLLVYIAVELVFTAFEFMYLFLIGVFRTLGYLCTSSALLFWLVLVTYIGLSFSGDYSGWFDTVSDTSSAGASALNVAFGTVNFLGTAAFALFLAPYNFLVAFGVQFIFTIGDAFGANEGSSATLSDDASQGHGRRMEDAGTPEPFLAVVEALSVQVTHLLSILGTLILVVVRIVLAIFVPVLPAAVETISAVALPLGCVTEDIVCGLQEVGQVAVIFFVTAVNGFLKLFTKPLDSLGFHPTLWVAPDITCSADQLAAVACACSAFFGNQQPCGSVTYGCTMDSDSGKYSSTTTQNDVTTQGMTSTSSATACQNGRRALSAVGHMLNMEETGHGLACHWHCVNATLFRACPPVNGEHVLTYEGACGGRRRLSEEEPVPRHDAARFLAHFFQTTEPVVIARPSRRRDMQAPESVREASRKERAALRQKHARERDTNRATVSHRDLEAKLRKSLADFPCVGPVECDYAASATPDAVTHHVDLWLMMQQNSEHARRESASHGTYLASATKTWIGNVYGTGKRRRTADRGGSGLMRLATTMSIRASVVPALDARGMANYMLAPVAHSSAIRRELVGEEPETALMEGTVRQVFAAMRRELAHIRAVTEVHHSTRRTLVALSVNNIWDNPARVACHDHLCYDGVTCIVNRRDCPAALVVNPTIAVNYALWSASIAVDDLDARVVWDHISHCWRNYNVNPKKYPFSIQNVGKGDILEDPNLVWCAPMVRPFTTRLPRVEADLRTWMRTQCAGEACACDGYYNGDFDTTNWWFRGVPFFVLSRIHNAAASAQWFISDALTKNGPLDVTWQQFFLPLQPVLPLWFIRLWGDQGHAGTYNSQLMCAVVHTPDIFYVVLLASLAIILHFGFAECFFFTFLKLFILATLPTEFYLGYLIKKSPSASDLEEKLERIKTKKGFFELYLKKLRGKAKVVPMEAP